MSLRKKVDKPVTKGLALILAREILGPSAGVTRDKELYIVGMFPFNCSGHDCGVGATWEEALELASMDSQAEAWQNYKDNRKNAFLEAVASLRATIREILGSKDIKLFTRAEHKFVRGALGRLA